MVYLPENSCKSFQKYSTYDACGGLRLRTQYGSVKARDAINRRLYKGLIIVKTAIYRVFAI
ncbi:MAG: hypothetical protein V7K92_11560 [Nostoc sp.]|uniref:hypothetical protein n=1 Tax=Nostoc sp. TaxID=1180 RepID=UPI002FF3232D